MILKCGCNIETGATKFQDETYGKGRRVCNMMKPPKKGQEMEVVVVNGKEIKIKVERKYRCTICKREHHK